MSYFLPMSIEIKIPSVTNLIHDKNNKHVESEFTKMIIIFKSVLQSFYHFSVIGTLFLTFLKPNKPISLLVK